MKKLIDFVTFGHLERLCFKGLLKKDKIETFILSKHDTKSKSTFLSLKYLDETPILSFAVAICYHAYITLYSLSACGSIITILLGILQPYLFWACVSKGLF